MSTFCLIHGSTAAPDAWQPLVRALEARGHAAVCPDLPVDAPQLGGMAYAELAIEALAGIGEDLVVVGHSALGTLVPLIAARRPVRHQVFLASLVPRIGHSLLELLDSPPGVPPMLQPDYLAAWQSQVDFSREHAQAVHFLLHDVASYQRLSQQLASLRTMQIGQAFQEVCPLTAWPEVPSSYLACMADRTFTPAWQQWAARTLLGVEAIELEAGHMPQAACPDRLADLLVAVAAERPVQKV